MGKMEKFELPDDAYPKEFEMRTDSHIKEFNSRSADLLRYVNGAAPDALDKLRAMGVDQVVMAMLDLVDRAQHPEVHLGTPRNKLVAILYSALDAMIDGFKTKDNQQWT